MNTQRSLILSVRAIKLSDNVSLYYTQLKYVLEFGHALFCLRKLKKNEYTY